MYNKNNKEEEDVKREPEVKSFEWV